jgi:4-hydroxy-3-methylbut-2-enyl diphosphate reductase
MKIKLTDFQQQSRDSGFRAVGGRTHPTRNPKRLLIESHPVPANDYSAEWSTSTEVVRAETAGFCMGVILALQMLDSLIREKLEPSTICTLGPIIHNPQVLDEYARKGVATADCPEDIPAGATAVIRAHGVPKLVKKNLQERGIPVIDATCPKVKKAQLLIEKQARQGRMLLLYGEESHPEVKGLLSYAEAGAFVFDTREKLEEFHLVPGKPYCLAAQTTQDRETFEQISYDLARRPELNVTVLQTICDATRHRQEEAVRIAREVDFMVVVGGFNSGNTRRLVQVIAAENTPVLHVESPGELPLDKMKKFSRIGLTAGASTPKRVIDQIQDILESLPETHNGSLHTPPLPSGGAWPVPEEK